MSIPSTDDLSVYVSRAAARAFLLDGHLYLSDGRVFPLAGRESAWTETGDSVSDHYDLLSVAEDVLRLRAEKAEVARREAVARAEEDRESARRLRSLIVEDVALALASVDRATSSKIARDLAPLLRVVRHLA